MRNKEVMNFSFSHIFGKHFLTSPYEYALGSNDDVIASLFSIDFIDRKWQKSHFQENQRTSAILTSPKMINKVYSVIFHCMVTFLPSSDSKNGNFHNFIHYLCNKLWRYDIITSPLWIFIGTVQELFSENKRKFKKS